MSMNICRIGALHHQRRVYSTQPFPHLLKALLKNTYTPIFIMATIFSSKQEGSGDPAKSEIIVIHGWTITNWMLRLFSFAVFPMNYIKTAKQIHFLNVTTGYNGQEANWSWFFFLMKCRLWNQFKTSAKKHEEEAKFFNVEQQDIAVVVALPQ